jgi:VanZ family protein
MSYLNARKNVPSIICLIITSTILVAGLWPFNFWSKNQVEWLKDRDGVRFYSRGIIYSEKEVPILPSLHSSNIPTKSFTIEIWVQPDKETFSYLPQLLTIWNRETHEYLFIGQWQSTLIFQSRILDSKKKWIYKKIGIGNVLQKDQTRFIAITSDERGTNIYIDGRLEESSRNYLFLQLTDKTMSSNFLVLGNSSTGQQHWMGSLLGLAIYDQPLTRKQISEHFQKWQERGKSSLLAERGLFALYLFDEGSGEHIHDLLNHHHLVMPLRFEVLQKTILVPPWKDFRFNRSYLMDIITNILCFIPFGFFFSAYLWMKKPRSIFRLLLTSIIIAGCMSLSIELIQVYLPTRSSQLMDVITNILGAAIGVTLFLKNRKS